VWRMSACSRNPDQFREHALRYVPPDGSGDSHIAQSEAGKACLRVAGQRHRDSTDQIGACRAVLRLRIRPMPARHGLAIVKKAADLERAVAPTPRRKGSCFWLELQAVSPSESNPQR